MSYAEFLHREILDPLVMRNTRLEAQGGADPMTRMSPGGPLKEAMLSPLRSLRASPAGGIFSTEIAFYPESGWQLIALSNRDPPVASRMITVLQKAIFASDTAAACTAVLADPDEAAHGS
jgi:CubicO group peptidase (beta-lactamase class C family)